MDFRFSEIAITHPDNFNFVKRVSVQWSPKPLDELQIDELLSELKNFLLRDKTKDFPESEFCALFLSEIVKLNDPQITVTNTPSGNTISHKLSLLYIAGMDMDAAVQLVIGEILSTIASNNKIEIYSIGFWCSCNRHH